MTETKKTYTLGKIKQLIDLNGDSVNFDLKFKVSGHDSSVYNMLVVDQTTLDNNPELEYKEVKGTISGNIVADKNVFQNYFLILKSENPCKVDVEIVKKVLPKTPTGALVSSTEAPTNSPVEVKRPEDMGMLEENDDLSNKINWGKIILIAIVIIGGAALLWYLFKQNKEVAPSEDIVNKLEGVSSSGGEELPVVELGPSLGEVKAVSTEVAPAKLPSPSLLPSPSPSSSSSSSSSSSCPREVVNNVKPDSSSFNGSEMGEVENSLLERLKKYAR